MHSGPVCRHDPRGGASVYTTNRISTAPFFPAARSRYSGRENRRGDHHHRDMSELQAMAEEITGVRTYVESLRSRGMNS